MSLDPSLLTPTPTYPILPGSPPFLEPVGPYQALPVCHHTLDQPVLNPSNLPVPRFPPRVYMTTDTPGRVSVTGRTQGTLWCRSTVKGPLRDVTDEWVPHGSGEGPTVADLLPVRDPRV